MNEYSYSIELKSKDLLFSVKKYKEVDKANEILQNFVRYLEKKFDSIWYIGTDFIGENIYERFIFHHGGFMEISLSGEIRAYFIEDKKDKFLRGLKYALTKIGSETSANHFIKEVKIKQRLINLKDSIK